MRSLAFRVDAIALGSFFHLFGVLAAGAGTRNDPGPFVSEEKVVRTEGPLGFLAAVRLGALRAPTLAFGLVLSLLPGATRLLGRRMLGGALRYGGIRDIVDVIFFVAARARR